MRVTIGVAVHSIQHRTSTIQFLLQTSNPYNLATVKLNAARHCTALTPDDDDALIPDPLPAALRECVLQV